jgi:hypothetical protein
LLRGKACRLLAWVGGCEKHELSARLHILSRQRLGSVKHLALVNELHVARQLAGQRLQCLAQRCAGAGPWIARNLVLAGAMLHKHHG